MVSGTIAKFTTHAYHQIIESGALDDRNVELLEGLIIEMAAEGVAHAYLSDEAGDYLAEKLGSRVKVREGKPITLPNDSEPQPDLAIVKPLGAVYFERHPAPSDVYWLIEYSDSSLKKDMEQKARIYAVAGIKEYWVVNLQKTILVVFRDPVNGKYRSTKKYDDGEISPLDFPDTKLLVSRFTRKSV